MENDCENETELIGRDALLYMVKAIQDETRTEREEYLLHRVVEVIKFLPKARVKRIKTEETKEIPSCKLCKFRGRAWACDNCMFDATIKNRTSYFEPKE